MRLVALSWPTFLPEEAALVRDLFAAGLPCLHVRKPTAPDARVRQLLEAIGSDHWGRIALHHRPALAATLGLGGRHARYADLASFERDGRRLSVSVHRWSELATLDGRIDYVLIGPVFDSLTKRDYPANPALRAVPPHQTPVLAVGGVTAGRLPEVRRRGYEGAAVLGYLWQEPTRAVAQWEKLVAAAKIA